MTRAQSACGIAVIRDLSALAARQRLRRLHVQRFLAQAAFRHDQGVDAVGAEHCSAALPMAAESPSGVVGKGACATRMVESRLCVISPITLCCGSSSRPGWPRQVTISRVGMRNGRVERSQRIDGVAEAGVLAHHDGLAAGEPGARGDGHRLALAGRADIVEALALERRR